MTNTDKHKGHKGRYFNGKLVDNYLNMQLEIKRLREDLKSMVDIRDEINTALKDEDDDGPFDVMLKIESILHKNRWITYEEEE